MTVRKTRRKRTVTRRRTVHRRRRVLGRGFFDGVRKVHDWIKKNKIISSVGNALGGVIPIAGTIGRTAANFGYGRRPVRRTVRRRRIGGALPYYPGAQIGIPRY